MRGRKNFCFLVEQHLQDFDRVVAIRLPEHLILLHVLYSIAEPLKAGLRQQVEAPPSEEQAYSEVERLAR